MKFYPAWAEINLNFLEENLQIIREEVGSGVEIAPMLKHDAFGHGAAAVAKRLMQLPGVSMFCLETVEECKSLRIENIDLPLLLVSDFYTKELPLIMEYDVTVSVYSLEKAQLLSKFARKAGKQCRVHLRVDINNEYDGIRIQDFYGVYEAVRKLKNLRIDGVYTQIYSSYEGNDDLRIKSQVEDFKRCIASIPENQRKSLYIHAAGSECIFKYPDAYFNLIRPGMSLFNKVGVPPFSRPADNPLRLKIKQVMRIKARIESIFEVGRETEMHLGRIGLGRNCRRVANLSIGWWEVSYLFMERDGYALLRGKKAKVITSPQFDRVLVDVSDIPQATIEDEVSLLGEADGTAESSSNQEQRDIVNFKRLLHTGERLPKRYTNWSEHAVEFPAAVLYDIRRELPRLDDLLNRYGDKSLDRYIHEMEVKEMESLEPKADVAQAVYSYAAPLLGEDMARKTREYLLSKNCLLPTALHHGMDFDACQIQGNLLFYHYLKNRSIETDAGVIPMLACGGVDLSSSTYPRGLRCYATSAQRLDSDMEVLRLPLFDSSAANAVVCATPPFTQKMVERLHDKIKKKEMKAFLSTDTFATLERILHCYFCDPLVLAQDSYAKQATILNRHLQQDLVRTEQPLNFIYIQMEDIVTELLLKDMQKESSLTWKILFQNTLRNELLSQLDGETGCWSLSQLSGNNGTRQPLELKLPRHRGTCFFWGISSQNRRIPLYLDQSSGMPVLRSADNSDETFIYPFNPQTVRELLEKKILYPGVFLIMFCLKFLRGYALGGGCFQIEYTRKMRDGIVRTLRKDKAFADEADVISRAQDDQYLEGPLFGVVEDPCGGFVEAGPLELISRGGLSEKEFRNLMEISFHDSTMIGALMMYSDVYAQTQRMKKWHSELSGGLEELYGQLSL